MFNKPALPPQPLPTGTGASEQSAPVMKPGASDDIYIMPEKFHSDPIKSPSNKPLIIAAIILVAVIVLVGAYFIYDLSVQKQVASQQAANNAALQSSTPVVEPVNEGVAETTTTEPVTTTEPEATSTAEEATSSPEAATTTEPAVVAPAISRDSDNDGLTDMEEDVIGTNPAKPDTDVDGYKDGEELLSGYNPLSDGSQGKSRLFEADFIASAKSDFSQNNFSFLYPNRWKVSFVPENGQAIISIDTGEIIRLSSRANEQNISAMNWYLQLHPQISVSQLKQISTPQLTGFFTPDGLSAYLTDANKQRIYSFEYLTSPQSEFRYPALFAMVINNFQIVTSTQDIVSSTPSGQ